MILDLKSIFISDGASLAVNFELDLSEISFSGICPIKEPVPVRGSVFNRAGIVTVEVVCDVAFCAPCDRCGKQSNGSYKVEIKRTLVSQLAAEVDDEIIEIPDMQLDISELCITETVLSFPMKHLCKPDCKGICATCGKDLNEGDCNCKQDSVDPRLQALAQLLD